MGILALQLLDLITGKPGSTPTEVGGHRPQVSDEISGLDQRPRSVERAVQLLVLQQRPVEQLRGHLIVVIAVEQDRQQRLPDLLAGFVVRRAGVGCLECLRPIGGTEPDGQTSRSRRSSPWWAVPRT